MKSFSGAKMQDLEHYIAVHLEHGKPDFAVILIGINKMLCNDLDIDASILAKIILIGNKWIGNGIEEVVISSIF